MDLIGWGIGLIGIAVAVYGIWDARRERSRREASVVVINRLVGRLNGVLIGLKPSIVGNPHATAAVDDSLGAIAAASESLNRI